MKCTGCAQEVATDQLGSLLPHSRNPALSSATYDPCPGTLEGAVAVSIAKKRSRRTKGAVECPGCGKQHTVGHHDSCACDHCAEKGGDAPESERPGVSAAPGGAPGQVEERVRTSAVLEAAEEVPMTETTHTYTAEPPSLPKKRRKASGTGAWSGFLVAGELSDPLPTFEAAQKAARHTIWANNASALTVLNIYQLRLIAQVERGIKEQRFGRVRKAKQRRTT